MTWSQLTTWRPDLRELRRYAAEYPLVVAFVISLLIHLTLYGGYRFGRLHGWWSQQATWLLHLNKKSRPPARLAALPTPLPDQPKVIPLTFVEVDPATVAEPPKETKYYGAVSSQAANPDPAPQTAAPKIEGQQTKMVRLVDVPRPEPVPLQPTIVEPAKTPAEAEPKPKGGEEVGDLAKARPEEIKPPTDGKAASSRGGTVTVTHGRPRTLAAARAQNPALAGEKMKQDGGVKRRGKIALDVKATPFGAYDAALIAAVQQRWYDLLDSTRFTQRTGKVVLEFRLNNDGRISDMRVSDNEVGEMLALLCQRAVLDPAPFPKWPSDMWRMIGRNYREVTFTFYYN
jgi:hypothetical protein